MKLLVTLVVAALAALAGRRLGDPRTPSAAVADPGADHARIAARIQELRGANERLEQELARRSVLSSAAPAAEGEIGDDAIAAALARWRAAHPEVEERATAARAEHAARPRPDELDLATVPMPQILAALSRADMGDRESEQIFQELREAGRIDEYVAAIEALAAADPEDPELQVALGVAYLQKLFTVGNTPEAGPWAMKADAAFDQALELDDHNWAARFTKAVSLSNWPAFLGRAPEAIEHFEILLEQQAAVPQRDEFAMTYLFLGNMQQAGGEPDKALATWRAGLERFPNVEELRSALANAETGVSTQRSATR